MISTTQSTRIQVKPAPAEPSVRLLPASAMASTSLLILGLMSTLAAAHGYQIPDRGFVVVQNGAFWLNCQRFVFSGCNSWDLMTNASDPDAMWTVNSTFDAMNRMNLTVVRTWGYSQLPDAPFMLSPGSYNETLFRAFDFVLEQARNRGIRVLISLFGYWNPVDGVAKVARWAGLNNTDDFFSNEYCKEIYINHVKAFLGRVNTFNNRVYSEDPTIFGWDLLSEPRCFGDGCKEKVQNWVEEMSARVKALDSNHLVTTGFEGFYSASSDHLQYNPGEPSGNWASQTGQDFVKNHAPWSIDFAVAHLWVENWIANASASEKLDFVEKWVSVHQQDTQDHLGKPLVWEEFGEQSIFWNNESAQEQVYNAVYPLALNSLLNGGLTQGLNFWVFNSPDGQYDYTVVESSPTGQLIKSYSDQIVAYHQSFGKAC